MLQRARMSRRLWAGRVKGALSLTYITDILETNQIFCPGFTKLGYYTFAQLSQTQIGEKY